MVMIPFVAFYFFFYLSKLYLIVCAKKENKQRKNK